VARYRRRKNERGFALLLVFLMAAIVGITLYMEVPRVAMQSQRDKEQALIDRGEQYKRAIQLFVAKAKRYPGDIKELENFQNQRFLRQRYIDPMTGKDEWRLIHIQGGVLTDSKVTKPNGPGGKEEPKGPNGFVGEQAGMGALQNQPQGGGAANARDRRRPSEGNNASMPGPAVPGGDLANGQNTPGLPVPGQTPDNGQSVPGQIGQPTPAYPGMPVPAPQGFPGQATVSPGMVTPGMVTPGQPVYSPGMPAQPGMPGAPSITAGRGATMQGTPSPSGNSFVGGGGSFVGGGGSYVGGGSQQPAYPGQSAYPGQTGIPLQPGQSTYTGSTAIPPQPGQPVNSQTGGMSPYPIQPGANGTPPGFPQPGTVAGQGNPAADMIRNILTTPRPGGMPQTNPGGQTIGGGIAGVATTAEGEGVKVYNDRTLYQEWEFIYDPQKQKQIPNPNAVGAGGTPADRMNNNGQPSTSPGVNPQTGRPGQLTGGK
jgi:type II secretory pathway pseudopilin PulG